LGEEGKELIEKGGGANQRSKTDRLLARTQKGGTAGPDLWGGPKNGKEGQLKKRSLKP